MHGKKGLFNFINDIPLNSKFTIIYIFCVLVPILTINLIFWRKISMDVKEREIENYNISMNRVISDISSIIYGCVDISHSVSTDKYLYEMMDRQYKNDSEYYAAYHDLLRDKLNRYLPIYNDVKQIALYTTNDTIDSGGNYYYIDAQIRNSSWYREIHKLSNKVGLYTYLDKSSDGGGNYVQYISVLRRLTEFTSSSQGYEHVLKIDIDINKLYEIFYRERDYLDLFLVDPQDRVICSTGGRWEKDLSKGFTDFSRLYKSEENSNYLIRTFRSGNFLSGWKIIGVPSSNPVVNASGQSNIYIPCIIFVVTLISSMLIWIIVRSYNYRLKKLHKHMKGVENEKFELIEIARGKDEIGELVQSFNMMTSKINTLINDVYKLQLKKKDLEIQRVQAELNFLQSQVDPHFLFNTLNAVMAICVKNNYEDLTEVIKYLSKIFRRLISWKDDIVTVREEISFTEMYLKIEKFRFLEKFHYEIQVDEEILELKVPKMSIQTLVENACKHGIQSSEGVGIVKIHVRRKGDYLSVDVEDNGSGIEPDKLHDILDMLEKEDSAEKVGISNVYKRLKLYYGDEVEFYINSELNKGTVVHYGINVSKQHEYAVSIH